MGLDEHVHEDAEQEVPEDPSIYHGLDVHEHQVADHADEIARPLEDDTTGRLDSTSDDVMHHVFGEPVIPHTMHEISNAK